jgi:hypothetical protein
VFVKKEDGCTGFGAVYRLDPPMEWSDWSGDEVATVNAQFVWVHAANVPFSGPETYIFPCDSDGEVKDWAEMQGSFKGGMDLERALEGAGYVVEAAQ